MEKNIKINLFINKKYNCIKNKYNFNKIKIFLYKFLTYLLKLKRIFNYNFIKNINNF